MELQSKKKLFFSNNFGEIERINFNVNEFFLISLTLAFIQSIFNFFKQCVINNFYVAHILKFISKALTISFKTKLN